MKILLWVLVAIILIAGGFLLFLDVREYEPEPVAEMTVTGKAQKTEVPCGETLSILSWNVGYGALGKDADFAMDGGGNAPKADKQQVQTNLDGIIGTIDEINPDFSLIQEVDYNSSRSYNIDERDVLQRGNSAFALNYSCDFVPFPWPPFGRVNSGILTTTDFVIERADRHSLPNPFSWPLRLANLKRCMLVSYFPIEGSDKQLVIVNFHLEAYSSGESKREQTKQLAEFVDAEVAKGNYVIAGGDWNQVFPNSTDVYPNNHPDLWDVGEIDTDLLENVDIAADYTSPTCRLLNQPYNPDDKVNTQFYVIDGFILSPNIQCDSVVTMDENFEYTDHNPVLVEFTLLPEN